VLHLAKQIPFGVLHWLCSLGITHLLGLYAQGFHCDATAQILFRLGQRQQGFQRCLVAPITARLFSFSIDFHSGLRTGPMQVQIRVEVLSLEAINAFGLRRRQMAITHVFANHGSVLGFDQPVVVAVPRPALALLDEQFAE
jgi:hypothetical protein